MICDFMILNDTYLDIPYKGMKLNEYRIIDLIALHFIENRGILNSNIHVTEKINYNTCIKVKI